jgi:hypothetical protein
MYRRRFHHPQRPSPHPSVSDPFTPYAAPSGTSSHPPALSTRPRTAPFPLLVRSGQQPGKQSSKHGGLDEILNTSRYRQGRTSRRSALTVQTWRATACPSGQSKRSRDMSAPRQRKSPARREVSTSQSTRQRGSMSTASLSRRLLHPLSSRVPYSFAFLLRQHYRRARNCGKFRVRTRLISRVPCLMRSATHPRRTTSVTRRRAGRGGWAQTRRLEECVVQHGEVRVDGRV